MISLDHVDRSWPEFAIRDISLQVAEGQYLVLMGPTGAGKTLLLELLLGIHAPDRGRIFIAGEDVTNLPAEKRGIGMVYQDYLLFPHLSVAENIAFGLRYKSTTRSADETRVRETAALLGISHLLSRYPATLSGGEKQRVAIGRALAIEPRILLLDEPLSALDSNTARNLRRELKSLQQSKNLTVVHVTHDVSEARQLGDVMAIVKDGTVNAYGPPEELFRRPRTLFAANFGGAVNIYPASIEQAPSGPQVTAGPLTAPWLGDNSPSEVYMMILPDEVELLPGNATKPGVLQGELTAINSGGNYLSLEVRIAGLPAPLTFCQSHQSVRARKLLPSDTVNIDVSGAIHIFTEELPNDGIKKHS